MLVNCLQNDTLNSFATSAFSVSVTFKLLCNTGGRTNRTHGGVFSTHSFLGQMYTVLTIADFLPNGTIKALRS